MAAVFRIQFIHFHTGNIRALFIFFAFTQCFSPRFGTTGSDQFFCCHYVYCGFVISFLYLYKHRGASASRRSLPGERRIPVRPHKRISSFRRP